MYDQSAENAPSPTAAVEAQLWGKSHYFDRDTRRFFNARVIALRVADNGRYLGVVASLVPPDGRRRYEAVIFDETGDNIHRTERETGNFPNEFRGHLTAKTAHDEMDREWNRLKTRD